MPHWFAGYPVQRAPKYSLRVCTKMSDDRTILITGGMRRLGKAIALHFVQLGSRLVPCYANDADAAESARSSPSGAA
jgi:hypothetical protein